MNPLTKLARQAPRAGLSATALLVSPHCCSLAHFSRKANFMSKFDTSERIGE